MADTVLDRVATALACAAFDPELRGVLLFDLRPELAAPLGRRLAQALGTERTTHLGSGAREDALWSRPTPRAGSGITISPGPLVDPPDGPPPVVVVGDLARLGLAERRAAITLLDGDVAHLERDGLSLTWTPRSRWLAACARADVGRVSPHLLDRFPIRIDASELTPEVLDALDRLHSLPAGPPATVPSDVIGDVMALTGRTSPGMRRELALIRLARALATLAGRAATTMGDVDAAASLIGLAAGPDHRPGADEPSPDRPGDASGPPAAEAEPVTREVIEPDAPEPTGPDAFTLAAPFTPYPEDEVEVGREPGTLRPSPSRRALPALNGGWPIGVRPADRVDDIAVVATFLEAARHQARRCPDHFTAGHATHMRATDLRSYRRGGRPNKLLALVLDHTCHDRWDWTRPLAPYLQWAYSGRAAVCVVEVGAQDAACEARAQRFLAAGLLDPRVLQALDRPRGRCTPLAHGLDLVASLLRDRMHRGRLPSEDVLLVVVTDGRGNVPLAASRLGALPDYAGGEGFRDSLHVARTIRALGHVETVVVDPGPRHNARLTVQLSEALGARLLSDREAP
ncbi:hypothetical protein [Actinomadura terrae]|uniref:hypothetical protein n=1 Tax=Actinomadura terrae TaxID=604353 RepID=UPI001FA7C3E9|nr:hypothetical protein [Actinomadura terrae]